MTDVKKILVVEDNDFVRMQIVKFLNEEGYETIEGRDGKTALEIMNDEVSLAIVDVRMAPIDGFEFMRALKAEDNNTPVVLVTGDQNPELLSDASKLGVAALLMKPVQRERLIKTVQRTLRVGRS